MSRRESRRQYRRRFVEFSQNVERWLLILTVSLFVLLLLFQILLRLDSLRPILSKVDRLEGTPYDTAQSSAFHGTTRIGMPDAACKLCTGSYCVV